MSGGALGSQRINSAHRSGADLNFFFAPCWDLLLPGDLRGSRVRVSVR